MSKVTELVNEFKKRDNPNIVGNTLGTILSLTPLKVGILNNEVILDKTNCFLCSNLIENYKRNAVMEIKDYSVGCSAIDGRGDTISNIHINTKADYDTVITFKDILKTGDIVLLIPDSSGQTFFVLDRVVI
ncbi:DUF2577 family protein [Clostridium tagluense]|uniref:DUF2577 family protein n=1 Tax=Clostridium tagluense TaxID=360422 RepID=UPI001C6EF7BA|nr:DUF2577 family protein [Clostridium tagluense]MBW9154855.1 DUF2577 domain-containing protein [Clostridium tagluense]WLC64310.1 DUF2577 domain-containing protein [Clostridium tagluense]